MMSRLKKYIVPILLISLSTCASLMVGELILRLDEGHSLTQLPLRPLPIFPQPNLSTKVEAYAQEQWNQSKRPIPFDSFWQNPMPIEQKSIPPEVDTLIESYAKQNQTPAFNFSLQKRWNIYYLHSLMCQGDDNPPREIAERTNNYLYTFIPDTPSIFPHYRFFRRHENSSLPAKKIEEFVQVNNFGWRGPDISLNKSDSVIRIAFIGASTTQSNPEFPYSYPEYIIHWLNQWAKQEQYPIRFEGINAGRAGLNSSDIAAVVKQELLPLKPDMFVYYEGHNDLNMTSMLRAPDTTDYASLPYPYHPNSLIHWGVSHSEIARRAFMQSNISLPEPAKPPINTQILANLKQTNLILAPRLPFRLSTILKSLNSIRQDVTSIDAALIICSFSTMVKPDMTLNALYHRNIYANWNRNSLYAHIPYNILHQGYQLQNRLFEQFAQGYSLAFIDIAQKFPQDPDLFQDAVHNYQEGLRLRAWIAFLSLTSILQPKIEAGKLPKSNPSTYTSHPTLSDDEGQKAYLNCDCSQNPQPQNWLCIKKYIAPPYD